MFDDLRGGGHPYDGVSEVKEFLRSMGSDHTCFKRVYVEIAGQCNKRFVQRFENGSQRLSIKCCKWKGLKLPQQLIT